MLATLVRRAIGFAALGLASIPLAAAKLDAGPVANVDTSAPDQTLVFDVLLNERPIGVHTFALSSQADALKVVSDVEMSVRLLFVEVFSYEHRAVELWRGDCLRSLTSSTRQNGGAESVDARQTDNGFEIRTTAPQAPDANSVVVPEQCVSGYAYWDRERLERSALLNAQNGELDAVQFSEVASAWPTWVPEGIGSVRTFELVSNEAVITLWYDQHDRWLGLKTRQDGRWLEYRRADPLGELPAVNIDEQLVGLSR